MKHLRLRIALISVSVLALAACATGGAPDCAKLQTGKNVAMTAAVTAATVAIGAQAVCGPADDPNGTGCKIARVSAQAAELSGAAAKAASDLYDQLCPTGTAALPRMVRSADLQASL